MGNAEKRAVERGNDVAQMHARLDTWAKRLEDALARAARPGSGAGDGYRIRIDGLLARHAALRDRLAAYERARDQTWGAFHAAIIRDWESVELAIEDLA